LTSSIQFGIYLVFDVGQNLLNHYNYFWPNNYYDFNNFWFKIGVHIPQNEAGAELVYRALCEAKRVSDEIIEKPNGGFILYDEIPNKGEASGQSSIQTFKVRKKTN